MNSAYTETTIQCAQCTIAFKHLDYLLIDPPFAMATSPLLGVLPAHQSND